MTLVFAILALLCAVIGLVPLLGILEWVALIFAVIAFILGIIGVCVRKHKGGVLAGLIISIIVLLISIVRLIIGGGLL